MAEETDDLEEQSAVEAEKQRVRHMMAGKTLMEMIKFMDHTQRMKKEHDLQASVTNAAFDVMRLELVPSKMDEDGVSNIKVEGIGRVSLTGDMYVRLKDKEGFFAWLKQHKLSSLIQQTVNSSTLKAFAKERLKKGLELPEAIQSTPFTRASITRS